ncbi:MAG TPA: hypothetical protein VGK23_11470 [Methanomassiliicoccales archaeon]
MTTGNKSLAAYRRNVYTVYHRDGLIDIAFGVIFLLLALTILTDSFLFSGLSGMVIFGYMFSKNAVISPRVGYVKFHNLTRGALLFVLITVMIVVLGLTLSFIYPEFPTVVRSSFQSIGELIVGSVLMASFAAIGYMYGLVRFYLYAVLMFSIFGIAQFFGGEVWVDLALIGLALTISGGILLERFLKVYPPIAEVMA